MQGSDYTYHSKSRVTEYTCGMAGATGGSLGQTYGYTYDDTNGTMSSMTVTASGVSDTLSFTYDVLQRLTASSEGRNAKIIFRYWKTKKESIRIFPYRFFFVLYSFLISF